MNLPVNGKTFLDKAIQDTRKKPPEKRIPLRDQAQGAVLRERTLLIDDTNGEDSTLAGVMSDG